MENIKIIKGTFKNDWDIQLIRHETWLKTYPNDEYGITLEDVESEFVQFPDTEEGRKKSLEPHRKYYDDPNFLYLMASEEEKFVGFFIGIKKEGHNRLLAIYVLPNYQGKGIGESLFKEGFNWFGDGKDIYVNLATYNKNAQAFYEKQGFVSTGKDATDTHHPLPTGKVIPEMEMVLRANKKAPVVL